MSEVRKEAVSQTRIEAGDEGQRLDNYLLRICRGVPKSHIYRILRSGEVRVNGKRSEAAYRVQAGDQIRIPPMRLPARPDEAARQAVAGAAVKVDLPVIFEDEALLALAKPPGVAVHGGSGLAFGVIEALRTQRPTARFLELAHRLDRETSGLLLVGKKRSALKALHDMFRVGSSDKRYLVLVVGQWTEPVKHVKLPLYKFLTDEGERRVEVDAEAGRPAYTIFRRLATGRRFSLLEAQLKTGRTHQIRVHLAHLGFPIAGDEKYGDFPLNKALAREGLKRMFLHAWRMRFPHPATGESLALEAPLAEDLRRYLNHLQTTGDLVLGKAL
jgi:23S rRNA pseudouridine955/2504/2580 synthase